MVVGRGRKGGKERREKVGGGREGGRQRRDRREREKTTASMGTRK